MSYHITLIPGDGTGPELAEVMKQIIHAAGVSIVWDEVEAGSAALAKYGTPLPEKVLESVRKNKVAIKGPITTPVGTGFRSVNVALRQELELYACLRPCKWYPGVRSRYQKIDLVIVRENTEDLYAGIEFAPGTPEAREIIELAAKVKKRRLDPETAISLKPISKTATRKIVRFAFEYAVQHRRKKVTAVHKANIMKFTDGLFLETAREIAKEYEGRIEFEDRIVDNMCMQLVQTPELYDVLVLPNLYGDILSDLCAGLIGGLGIAPGANIGDGYALFEPTHGSAPKYAGKNKVNPTAMILSAVLMLEYLGEKKAAKNLENAVAEVIREGKSVTYDLKADRSDPTAVGTREMGEAIIERLK
ncbi:MAG: isocitrate/isopropylmalate dehydrogenase family protein [Candidatus Omnitrophica bacterium]|nr:isocitrate/isopropylmalate dehydrogenase family protein [Candidatus Omnitrophota bacterium]